jgi:hypothetical protein
MDYRFRDAFRNIVCRIIAETTSKLNQNNTHLSYCRSVDRPPAYEPIQK